MNRVSAIIVSEYNRRASPSAFDSGRVRKRINMQRDGALASHLSKRPPRQRVISDHPLLKREEWLRLAAESAGIGLWYWNEVAWDLFWDRKSRQLFGVNSEGPVPLDAFYEALHPDDVKRVRKIWRSKLERGLPYQLEYRTKRPDGSIRWVNARGRGYYAKDRSPLRMVGVHVDVTEHKTLEHERLQLSGRLINAQEQERIRLARELHDDFAQRVALVCIDIESLANVTNDSLSRKRLSDLKEEVERIGVDLHTLSHRLHSSRLEILGLAVSVKSFCEEYADRHRIRIDFSHKHLPTSIPPDTALALYRIVQETLRNVTKHSHALSAKVILAANSTALFLTVTDNGVGFDPSCISLAEGIGLRSVKERASMIGGSLEVKSRPMQGTQITVTVPLKNTHTVAFR
jgi:PAS domain S-box-containing protein